MKKILPVLCLLLWMAADLKAQSNFVAAGGDASGTGGSASYSAGQTDYVSKTGTGGTMTEGVQQPFEITVISGINEDRIDLNATVFPNPASDFVQLRVSGDINPNLVYELVDVNGKIIEKNPVITTLTKVDMSSLSKGTYFLKVNDSDKTIKSFQIIKTN